MQKVFILEVYSGSGLIIPKSEERLQELLDKGWVIKSSTPQSVSHAYGNFLLVLER